MLRFQLGDAFTLEELQAISPGSFVWNDMNVLGSVEADGRTTVCFWPARWTCAAGLARAVPRRAAPVAEVIRVAS